MNPVATYSFLPWLRQGVANTIAAADHDPAVKTRASVHVELTLAGDAVGGSAPLTEPIARDIALFGPGDIIGIDSRAIVRTEPRAWITNFEANYLAAVDFYDEDFPWRYTPAASDGSHLRLRPWIALVVLKETEFTEGSNLAGKPLPFITVPDAGVFPPADDLWAWAHVHFNASLSAGESEHVSSDMSAVLPRVEAILAANPDLAYSRLMCPRRLEDNTAYHAFVVPVFETGRLAGLGSAPDTAPHATFSAWASYAGRAEPTNFPIYYRWYFRTGSHGDFEYLVRLLQPRPVDKRVGTRDMDVQDPGSNLPGITDAELGGILRLGGALRVPRSSLGEDDLKEALKYENWFEPYPHPFERALAAFINLPDDYAAKAASAANADSGVVPKVDLNGVLQDDPDPLITAPLDGRWHALTERLLTKRDGTALQLDNNWVHQLNLDPQYRVPAGFGTDAVETNAETYMNAAWEQIGDVLEANRRIRRLQLAKEVSWRLYDRHLTPLLSIAAERAYAITAPVARRVLVDGKTVPAVQRASLAPPALTSTAMRRVVRPGARMMRALPFDATATPGSLIARVNAGEVSAAPPKTVPPGVPTVDTVADAAGPADAPAWALDLLARYPTLPTAVLAIGIVLAIICALLIPGVGIVLGLAVAGAAYYAYRTLKAWQEGLARSNTLREEGQTPAAVDRMPMSPDFVLSTPGSAVRPTIGTTDSVVATRFKRALRDSFSLIATTKTVSATPPVVTLDVPRLTQALVTAIDPQVTIPRRGLSLIALPPYIKTLIGDDFDEIMHYPKIDAPMYEPLKDASIENFVPNLNLIPPNSITLVETNQSFIESYMVGVNHEFARKLLWREYPTDQRGSYFRQFWDVRSFFNHDNVDEAALKEKLYDIPELHLWPPASNLGEHNNRASAGEVGAEAVLVIRGELLKKYPTAVIFAQHALWFTDEQGNVDTTQPRILDEPTDAEAANPPPSKMRFPLYEAKADPDIYFFGFDLTIPQARGGTTASDDAGWFFVIKERPGEPRFGLELERSAAAETFDELTWDDAMPGVVVGSFLPAESLAAIALAPPAVDDPEKLQHDDDVQVAPAAVSAARWAYLLFRAPIMVAVHAAKMLAKP